MHLAAPMSAASVELAHWMPLADAAAVDATAMAMFVVVHEGSSEIMLGVYSIALRFPRERLGVEKAVNGAEFRLYP